MTLAELADRCEGAQEPDRKIDAAICRLIDLPACVEPDCLPNVLLKIIERTESGDWDQDPDCPFYTASLDAAMLLLEPQNDWRRLTPVSMSIFAASPYNAAAQVRYDGYGATPALQLCAAVFKMMHARLKLPAQAIEAQRAATVKQGAVHESAVGETDAPKGDA